MHARFTLENSQLGGEEATRGKRSVKRSGWVLTGGLQRVGYLARPGGGGDGTQRVEWTFDDIPGRSIYTFQKYRGKW